MDILGMEGLNGQQVAMELQRGAKFVIYESCMSFFVVTLKHKSDVYFIRAGHTC